MIFVLVLRALAPTGEVVDKTPKTRVDVWDSMVCVPNTLTAHTYTVVLLFPPCRLFFSTPLCPCCLRITPFVVMEIRARGHIIGHARIKMKVNISHAWFEMVD
eukprot:COSAG05_NODE_10772_length_547_cov_1.017857_1_plen_103_part_00